MKIISTVLLCGFLGGTWIWAAVRVWRFGKTEAFAFACYALGGCVLFLKVLSPQYFVWSIPMLLLAAVEVLPERGKPAWMLAGLLIVAAGLTTWLFPCHYFCAPPDLRGLPTPYGLIPPGPADSLAPSSLGYAVLALRNAVYLGVVAWIGAMLYKRAGQNECKSTKSAMSTLEKPT